jgi:hypothetical protein
MQRELGDTRDWDSPPGARVEAWYDPRRRHNSLGMLASHEFETPSLRHGEDVPSVVELRWRAPFVIMLRLRVHSDGWC